MNLFITLLLLAALNLKAGASEQKNVYLYEDLQVSTDLHSLSNQGYCVTWINAILADYRDQYEGIQGASYSCNIRFGAENPQTHQRTTGLRRIVYSSVPNQYSQSVDFGKTLAKNYGYFGFFGPVGGSRGRLLDMEIFAIPNSVLSGIYATASLLSSPFQANIQEQSIRLVPHFDSIYNAQQAACKVISLELVANACPAQSETIAESVNMQINTLTALEPLRRQMIPEKP